MMKLTIAAISAVLLTSTASAQQPAPRLTPSTKWSVDYADAQCTLSRTFGADAQALQLALVTIPGKDSADLVVLEPGASNKVPKQAKLAISVVEGKTIEASAPLAVAKDGNLITLGQISRADLSEIRSATSIDLTLNGSKVALALSSTAGALGALATCEDTLVRKWGYDPQRLAQIKTRPAPKGQPGTWLTDDDYPAKSLKRREQGIVRFRLDLDDSGKTQNCAILASSGYPELDSATCSLMLRRTQFTPARDAQGAPLHSMYFGQFIWRIPR